MVALNFSCFWHYEQTFHKFSSIEGTVVGCSITKEQGRILEVSHCIVGGEACECMFVSKHSLHLKLQNALCISWEIENHKSTRTPKINQDVEEVKVVEVMNQAKCRKVVCIPTP